MQTYGAFDAKTHFGQILKEVENGNQVTITRHGKKIAIIKPISEADDASNRVECAKKAIRELRRGVTLGDELSIKQLTEEGRR